MRSLRGLTLIVVAVVLVFTASGTAAGPTNVSNVYTVGGGNVPGVTTGLVLQPGMTVTVTATGAVCPFGNSYCPGPNGNTAWNTTTSSYGGFPLPGAPAWGLIGRVGSGPWVQVGSGPTMLSGSGALAFAVNDDLLSDNSGSFTVTVSYSCWPGWGYGDKNHTHCGPPGLAKEPAATRGSENGRADDAHAHSSDGPGKSEPRGEAKGHSKK